MARKFKDGDLVRFSSIPRDDLLFHFRRAYSEETPMKVAGFKTGEGYVVQLPNGSETTLRTRTLVRICGSRKELQEELQNELISESFFFTALMQHGRFSEATHI